MHDGTFKTYCARLHPDAGTDEELRKEVSGLTVFSVCFGTCILHTAYCIVEYGILVYWHTSTVARWQTMDAIGAVDLAASSQRLKAHRQRCPVCVPFV